MTYSAKKLPRMSSFFAGWAVPLPLVFYQRTLPLLRTVNSALDKAILVLSVAAFIAIAWLAFGATYSEPYVSDGVRSCKVIPIGDSEALAHAHKIRAATSPASQ